MSVLIVRHVDESDPPSFFVDRPGHKSLGPVAVTPAAGYPIEGSTRTLLRELRWYEEEFLRYPFHPDTLRAD